MVTENTAPTEATLKLEKQLLRTTWVKESELILTYVPEEDLTKNQHKLLLKCIDKEDFTDKQFADLKLLLNKYRLLLQKLNPEETIQNVEDVMDLIQTEQEFIDLMESDAEKYLTVHLPYKGKILPFEFEILPLEDSRVVETLQNHVDIFKDFDTSEATTYALAMDKKPEDLTEEESRIINKLNSQIAELVGVRKYKVVNNFLAHQLRIRGSDADVETRKHFWEKFHFNARFSIFVVVENRLGLTEVSNEKLFPFGE
ncbi:MAG: hypothetical protein IJH63_00360 [Methanobrevibacter sp.]|nr:hypothetical protein [Methanosphaera sp.]MBR0369156.1 hypothetical protein [Methanobrevibacter sp.]